VFAHLASWFTLFAMLANMSRAGCNQGWHSSDLKYVDFLAEPTHFTSWIGVRMRDTQHSSVAETSEGEDGNGDRTIVRDARWAVAMADIVAHLISAYSILEEVVWHHPQPSLAIGSYDMASQGVCVALVALDECSALACSEPGMSERAGSSLTTGSNWRDRVYSVPTPKRNYCGAP
jgi:hypothetical protein